MTDIQLTKINAAIDLKESKQVIKELQAQLDAAINWLLEDVGDNWTYGDFKDEIMSRARKNTGA